MIILDVQLILNSVLCIKMFFVIVIVIKMEIILDKPPLMHRRPPFERIYRESP